MTNLASRIERLRTAPLDELVSEYESLHGHPPRLRRPTWLWKKIAWRLQADRSGGLPNSVRGRLAELAADLDLPNGPPDRTVRDTLPARRIRPDDPTPGTVLVRRWHNQDIRVEVLDSGFAWEGIVYRSLSAVAKAVTGSHWNGRLFFGLTKRRRREDTS